MDGELHVKEGGIGWSDNNKLGQRGLQEPFHLLLHGTNKAGWSVRGQINLKVT